MHTKGWLHRSVGFSLLEMLVVLLIVGLLAALVATRVARPPTHKPEIIHFLELTRTSAINSGYSIDLLLTAQGLATSDGETLSISEEQVIQVKYPKMNAYLTPARLTKFYPDGTMTAAEFSISSPQSQLDVTLSPFSSSIKFATHIK